MRCRCTLVYRLPLYRLRNAALSSHPSPTRFTRPICDIKAAQHSASSSEYVPPVRNSLSRKDPELGDSAGERRRIESVSGARELASFKTCGIGLAKGDGIEWESVGANAVGGS